MNAAPVHDTRPFDAKAWIAAMEAAGAALTACYRPAVHKGGAPRGCIRWIECECAGEPGADRSEAVAEISRDPRRFEAVYLEIARRNGRWEKSAPEQTETELEAMGYA